MSRQAAACAPRACCTRWAVGGWGEAPVEVDTIRWVRAPAGIPAASRARAAARAARSEGAGGGRCGAGARPGAALGGFLAPPGVDAAPFCELLVGALPFGEVGAGADDAERGHRAAPAGAGAGAGRRQAVRRSSPMRA